MSIANALAHFFLKSFMAKDYNRFVGHSHNSMQIQNKYLLSLVARNSNTLFGQKHGFNQIRCVEDFQNQVPICNYEDYQGYINEIARGKTSTLTRSKVNKLVPTSGTSGFNKFIPYTKQTTAEFNRALNVWLYSLYNEYPKLKKGKAFWLISPAEKAPELESVVPVGFESDNSYFGRIGSSLIGRIMVLPPKIQSITDSKYHQFLLCLYLLSASDLTLISVWNPTYMYRILNFIVNNKESLVSAIRSGTIDTSYLTHNSKTYKFSIPGDDHRAQMLNSLIARGDVDKTQWNKVWPDLQLISCWTSAWAAHAIPSLRNLFKNIPVQGKGLLATEGVVTVPIEGRYLPAYFSHFFEFVDTENKKTKLLHELEVGKTYEVVLTTGSGLYRYRTQDLVKVNSYFNMLPDLDFLGKNNIVCDLVGEKLSETVVTGILNSLRVEYGIRSQIFFLSPCIVENEMYYTLYTGNEYVPLNISEITDTELCQIFYYNQARNLMQLGAVRVYSLNQRGIDSYFELFTNEHLEGTSKFLTLNKQVNLFEKLEGQFIR
jgi:hypothetical protein